MSTQTLHPYQNILIKKLALAPSEGLRFKHLIIEDVDSDHSNYHLKQLIRFGLVKKTNALYSLTDKGKDYSGSLDDAMKHVEKLPKTSVIVWAMRKRPDGVNEYLVNKRLRHPYYGKVGRITGKVLFGESLEDAAQRELYEETGLQANFMKLDAVYHKIRKRPDGSIVQDNIFFIFFMSDLVGTLVPRTEFQENFWITADDVRERRYDFYDDFILDDRDKPHPVMQFEEVLALAEGY